MNIVRGLDQNGDWTFGLGLGGYLAQNAMIKQNIQTRLQEQLGDCFFNLGAGVDPQLYAQKSVLALDLAIRGIILNTDGVTGLAQLSAMVNANRQVTFIYTAVTIYGSISDQYSYTIPQGSP